MQWFNSIQQQKDRTIFEFIILERIFFISTSIVSETSKVHVKYMKQQVHEVTSKVHETFNFNIK